jgi:hypothetical protein
MLPTIGHTMACQKLRSGASCPTHNSARAHTPWRSCDRHTIVNVYFVAMHFFVVQADPNDVSMAIRCFATLGYEPTRLIAALEDGLPHTSRLLNHSVLVGVNVLWCIAIFDMAQTRLYAWVMHSICSRQDSEFKGPLMYQVIVSQMLFRNKGCGSFYWLLICIVYAYQDLTGRQGTLCIGHKCSR